MKIIKVDAQNPEPEAIRVAADALRRGELVVFPTETVYGLAADAFNEDAVRRVFEVKGRNQSMPLPVQVADVHGLSKVAGKVTASAKKLGHRFWPGPLTLVLSKSPNISALVTGGTDTVGIRVPDHPVALALLREFGSPIIATSANISGEKPATDAEGAVRGLEEAVSVVLDAGETQLKVASTVVDVSIYPPKILRRGAISVDDIKKEVGQLEDIAD